MKKTTLYSALAAAVMISAVPTSASAAIVALNSVSGAAYNCNANYGTPPDSCGYGTNVASGSYFGMDGSGDGTITNPEKVRIDELSTLSFTDLTVAGGSHAGSINGSETPVSDIWEFFGGTGMHYNTSAMVDNNDGTISMSGWTVAWNGITAIPMGGDTANFAGDTGLATISCGACNDNDAFTLDYSAHVPLGDASGFGGVLYQLHLEGTITTAASVVPVPAAVWLFGSGLLGLVGVARRKSHA